MLRGIDFSLGPGEALALRGDNGAGKTTLLRLVAGLLIPDAGTVEVLGRASHAAPETRAHIGWVSGDERGLFLRLTGRHNLEFFAALHGLSARDTRDRITTLTEELELGDVLDRRVGECSSGMKARLAVARSLLHRPRLLLLDEPTRSLDERHAAAVHRTLSRRLAAGSTVILATHSRDEGSALGAAEHVLRDGRLELVNSGSASLAPATGHGT